jgi:hypothetical protein
MDPAELSAAKIRTNRLEEELSGEHGRRVNIDPGILTESNFILVTTKPFSHRIPLNHGIYGEVTLMYQKGAFRPQS